VLAECSQADYLALWRDMLGTGARNLYCTHGLEGTARPAKR
jgi:hypothetical protein